MRGLDEESIDMLMSAMKEYFKQLIYSILESAGLEGDRLE
jgi:hypothetical protein